jgi:NAD(P)-dependent dehydrogenase (short-subunit alcohol dehydrogenase family)
MKTVVVTGGTRGIGEGVSRVLAENGWSVIAASASPEERDAFEAHDRIELRHLDVTDAASVSGLFAGLQRLDGLVNCAGILKRDA